MVHKSVTPAAPSRSQIMSVSHIHLIIYPSHIILLNHILLLIVRLEVFGIGNCRLSSFKWLCLTSGANILGFSFSCDLRWFSSMIFLFSVSNISCETAKILNIDFWILCFELSICLGFVHVSHIIFYDIIPYFHFHV